MSDKMQLVVATPCFGGQVSSIYASSIFALQRAVHGMSNLELKVHLRDGDALITRARANLVTLFLDDPKTTHFLFIDADIGFKPEQVFRLIESGADVVAGCYPIKRVNWDKAKRAIQSGRADVPSSELCRLAVLPRAFARHAGGKPEPVRIVRMHDRSGDRHLPLGRLRLLQALDRYRRRDLGRHPELARPRRAIGVPRRHRLAIRAGTCGRGR